MRPCKANRPTKPMTRCTTRGEEPRHVTEVLFIAFAKALDVPIAKLRAQRNGVGGESWNTQYFNQRQSATERQNKAIQREREGQAQRRLVACQAYML
jgi:hypothetical protein